MGVLLALTSTATIGYLLFALIGAAGLCVLFYAALIEPYIIVRTNWKAPLPVKKPLLIAVVGDFHVGPFKGQKYMKRVVDKVNKQSPDIIFLVGDFLFDGKASPKPLEVLGELKSKYGVYAVLGNHENGHVLRHRRQHREEVQMTPLVKTLRAANIVTLHNEMIEVDCGESGMIAVVGIDDLWSGLDNLPAALANLSKDMPSVLLSHNPDIILDTDSHAFDLILAGHTHAGQVRLPFYGSVGPIPQQLGRKYDHGMFKVSKKANLFITRGVGESGLQLRLFAPPEVMMIETF